MSDELKSFSLFGPTLTVLGLARMTDNHGNSVSRNELTCSRQPPVQLSTTDFHKLYDDENLGDAMMAAGISARFEGKIPMLGNAESPLKAICNELHAKAHLQPTTPQHRK